MNRNGGQIPMDDIFNNNPEEKNDGDNADNASYQPDIIIPTPSIAPSVTPSNENTTDTPVAMPSTGDFPSAPTPVASSDAPQSPQIAEAPQPQKRSSLQMAKQTLDVLYSYP